MKKYFRKVAAIFMAALMMVPMASLNGVIKTAGWNGLQIPVSGDSPPYLER